MRFFPMTCLLLTINFIHAQNLQGYESGETQNREKRQNNVYQFLQHLLASSSNFDFPQNNYRNDFHQEFTSFPPPVYQNPGHERLVVNVNQPDSKPTTIINNLHPEHFSTCLCEKYVRGQNGQLQCLCPQKQIFTKCIKNTVCVLRSVCDHGLLFDTQHIPQGYDSQSNLCDESTHVCCLPPKEVRHEYEYGERQIYNHFINTSIDHLNNTVNKYVITGNVYLNNGNPTTHVTSKKDENVKFNVETENKQIGHFPSQLPSVPQSVSLSAQPQEAEMNPQYPVHLQEAGLNQQYPTAPQIAKLNPQFVAAPQEAQFNSQYPATSQISQLNPQIPVAPQISELKSQFLAEPQLNNQFSAVPETVDSNSQFSASPQIPEINPPPQVSEFQPQFPAQVSEFNPQISSIPQVVDSNPEFPATSQISQMSSQFPGAAQAVESDHQLPGPDNSVPASNGDKNLVQLNVDPSTTTSVHPSSSHTIPPNLVRPTKPTTSILNQPAFESKVKEDQPNSLEANNQFTNEVSSESESDLLNPNEIESIFGNPNQQKVLEDSDATVFPGLPNPNSVIGGLNLQVNPNEGSSDTTVGVSIIENIPSSELSQMEFPQPSILVPMKKPEIFLTGKIEKLRNPTRTNATTASQVTQTIGTRIIKDEPQLTNVFPTHAPAFNQVTGQSFNFEEPSYVPPNITPADSNLILRTCPSTMKCVQNMYCTPEGFVSTVPVILTPEQETRKNLLLNCGDESAGQIGKCCIDRNA